MKKRTNRRLFSMLFGGVLLAATLFPVLPLQATEAPATAQVSKPLTIIDLSELQIVRPLPGRGSLTLSVAVQGGQSLRRG
ncbi:hypothetical protein [Pantoea sp.]|uniref:hypothetical protein n=1 Tax=Pantoea sp. TaxID=69393 RepID=UPI0028AE841E|nr:hypothetical protein [Pantoea sp.]